MEVEENTVFLLYRRGKTEHIKALYENGEIFMNTIDFIRGCDDNDARTDSDDGIYKRQFLGDSIVRICDYGLDIDTHGIDLNAINCVITTDFLEKGNIYCLSGIYTNHLFEDRSDVQFDTKTFGESLILIHNPRKFIERLVLALENAGFEGVLYRSVSYYSDDYSGPVGFFRKHERFNSQNEFRFFVPNKLNEPIKISLGSIKDISSIENNEMLKITYTDEIEKLIRLG